MPDTTRPRSFRKDRETALHLITDLMAANPGVGFKPAELSTRLGLGRERVCGLLNLLIVDGKVARCGQNRFRLTDGEMPRPSDVQAWLAAGHELFGCPIRITLEVPDAS